MTEDEAKTKWCPFVRLPTVNGATFNRDAERTDEQTCINAYGGWANKCVGSSCMAWRWEWSPKDADRNSKDPFPVEGDLNPVPVGYCGLAGKP